MNDDDILQQAKIIRAKRERVRREKITNEILEATKIPSSLVDLPQRFPIILADPPWKYPFGKTDRSPSNHYETMPLADISALPVPEIATPDAILFVWTTNSFLADCLKVIEAWGFTYLTNMVWVKDKVGLGFYVRTQHELLVMAKRGQPLVPEPADRPSSVLHSPRTKHSSKPLALYSIIEQMYPTLPKLELFARVQHPGWHAWGNHCAPNS